MKQKKRISLGGRILIGILTGLLLGFFVPGIAKMIAPLGEIFLRLLKMLMVPLVFFSITGGVCKMGDIKQLSQVGLRFMLYIVITSGICAALGVAAGILLQPGKGVTEFIQQQTTVQNTVGYDFVENVISWVPENIIQAMASGDMLQIIIFSLFVGAAILSLGEQALAMKVLIDQGGEVMLKITEFVMACSPIGIAALMANMVLTVSKAYMGEVVRFIFIDNGCCALILFILYPFIIRCFLGIKPSIFMKKISQPMLVALTTTSSAATLPVSLRTAEEKMGVPEQIYGFTLPLGNTCGMNGFALFIGLLSVFASNLYGMELTVERIFQFVFLGIILSIGAAGIKGAGVVMSTVLLETLGLPVTVVPVLAAIWPILDPAHTLINNTSDLVGTAVVAEQVKKLDKSYY